MDVIRILSAQEARTTILVRRPPDEAEVTPQIAERLRLIFGESLSPDQAVSRIIRDVRRDGDRAVREYAKRIDGMEMSAFRVEPEELDAALAAIPESLHEALQAASDRIKRFHERQPTGSWVHWDEDGGVGHLVRPLERVGLYVPGGQAAYPSSLLMAAIPARVAGVAHVAVATPADRTGRVNPAVLAAARTAGVDAVYRVGGAQAIAAFAYGTESIPRVDKILGPGGLFVVLAKRQVYGVVDIDQLPGPTETLVIADESANPAYAAADLLAQAEHDALASAILMTPSRSFAEAVSAEVARQIDRLDRASIIRESLARNGGVVVTTSLDEAIDLANEYAPEHLCLLVRDPWALVGRVKHAGGMFVGEQSSEALGDYVVGPSHIMPTGGTARFASPLSVRDFLKVTSLFVVNGRAGQRLGPAAIALAEAEGLTAHAAAVKIRQR